jgi:uncharacterized protein (DUF433 family)
MGKVCLPTWPKNIPAKRARSSIRQVKIFPEDAIRSLDKRKFFYARGPYFTAGKSQGRKAVSEMFDRITFDPQVMGGRACIRGIRMTVSMVVNLVANGMPTEEILKEYPDLEPEDIRQALQYAASLAREEIHPFPEKRI